MKVTFHESAWEELLVIQRDRRLARRLEKLIADIQRGGHSGIGKPEQLTGELSGFWSRRIDDHHRLVYRLTADSIEITECYGHYGEQ